MIKRITTALFFCCLLLQIAGISNLAHAGEKKQYSFIFLSNPVSGKEDLFRTWYTGQHIHDLLQIGGFVAARFYELADTQFVGTHPQRYMMIWEIETDDLPAVFERVNRGLKTGTTVLVGAVDGSTANSNTFTPLKRRVTAEQIKGMTPEQVRMLATGH